MNAHTPGPWKVLVYDGGLDVIAPDNRSLALMVGRAEEGMHNARLIAAAPDLLEVAKGALQTLDRLPADTLAVPGISKLLRSAIAKAEGK